jgi:hypothetical protein
LYTPLTVERFATHLLDYFTGGTGIEILLQEPQGEVNDIATVLRASAAPELQFRPDTFENFQIARSEEEFIGGRLSSENHRFQIRGHAQARRAGDKIAGPAELCVR